ncbi:MAG: RidA family protein [Rhodothermales bacterium]|nr:RidA family protein [Rhodothermales bacterium]
MKQHIVDGAPEAIGPYCHAVETGGLVFCSGQTPLDPETMELVGTTIGEQTIRVFKNIEIVLNGLGLELTDIVKANVYLRDMADFAGMNAEYARAFGEHRPARTTVAVRQNPLDAMVEIECIAEIQSATQ